jgi:hypothetical protein
MFNSTILDVAIGLMFVYLVLALMCTTVNEWISGRLKMRARTLEEGLRGLLNALPDGLYTVREEDLKDPASLILKLQTGKDELTTHIRNRLAIGDKEKLDAFRTGEDVHPLMGPLVGALNRLIEDQNLEVAKLFPNVSNIEQQVENTKGNPQKSKAMNYRLLKEAYPNEISSLSDGFYSHPLIKGLRSKAGRHPSYVPARTFALAIMDIVTKGKQGPVNFADLLQGIQNLPNSDVKKSLLALLQNTDQTLETAQARIEGWFNDSMDRVSGWFKRKTQVVTIIVALTIAVFTNADTLQISNRLWSSPTLRTELVDKAKARDQLKPLITAEYPHPDDSAAEKPSSVNRPNEDQENRKLATNLPAQLGDLIGWSQDFQKFHQFEQATRIKEVANPFDCVREEQIDDQHCALALQTAQKQRDAVPFTAVFSYAFVLWVVWLLGQHLVGWALTTVAVSLGAPFWFDTLNRFMNLRSSGKSPDEDPKGAEKKITS